MTQFGPLSVETPTPVEIAFRRTYAVDRSLLFDAWTQVQHIERWWDPRGCVLAACEIDLRVGGGFRFVNQPIDGVTHEFTGTYLEIKEPSLLVFETLHPPAVGTLVFEQISEVDTALHMTIRCATSDQRDAMLKHGFVEGTTHTLQNLADHFCA